MRRREIAKGVFRFVVAIGTRQVRRGQRIPVFPLGIYEGLRNDRDEELSAGGQVERLIKDDLLAVKVCLEGGSVHGGKLTGRWAVSSRKCDGTAQVSQSPSLVSAAVIAAMKASGVGAARKAARSPGSRKSLQRALTTAR